MEHLIGKHCKLVVTVNGVNLFYLAVITKVDPTHFYFTDKFNREFGFRRCDLAEIKEMKEVKHNG